MFPYSFEVFMLGAVADIHPGDDELLIHLPLVAHICVSGTYMRGYWFGFGLSPIRHQAII